MTDREESARHSVIGDGVIGDGVIEQRAATQDALILTLLEAIDEPVGGDGGHVWRVQHGAQILADQLRRDGPYCCKIDDEFLQNLYRSSPLHDIGKIGVDRQILSKPDKLTASEFDAVKQHVQIGARLLRRAAETSGDVSFFGMAIEIAQYHHERYDGSGYCAALRGDEIPLAARIVALADVYDALTSERAYKPAHSPEAARSMIEAEAGRHFDPAIVEAFCARYAEFVGVVSQLSPSTFAARFDIHARSAPAAR
jgi:putative two-component system response regulator